MVAMTWSTLFWREYVLNNFDVSRQLTERREACLLRLLPRQHVHGGSQHEENLLLTSGGRAAVHWLVLIFDSVAMLLLPIFACGCF